MAAKIAAELISRLREVGLMLASAESCTGGLIADAIVSCPGASAVYLGGAVTYKSEMKISQLGVSPDVISAHTEVSAECAEEMALGAAERFGADIALSSTGYAGPNGEHVGLVYIGCAYKGKAISKRFVFDGNRNEIRRLAVIEAISLANEILKT